MNQELKPTNNPVPQKNVAIIFFLSVIILSVMQWGINQYIGGQDIFPLIALSEMLTYVVIISFIIGGIIFLSNSNSFSSKINKVLYILSTIIILFEIFYYFLSPELVSVVTGENEFRPIVQIPIIVFSLIALICFILALAKNKKKVLLIGVISLIIVSVGSIVLPQYQKRYERKKDLQEFNKKSESAKQIHEKNIANKVEIASKYISKDSDGLSTYSGFDWIFTASKGFYLIDDKFIDFGQEWITFYNGKDTLEVTQGRPGFKKNEILIPDFGIFDPSESYYFESNNPQLYNDGLANFEKTKIGNFEVLKYKKESNYFIISVKTDSPTQNMIFFLNSTQILQSSEKQAILDIVNTFQKNGNYIPFGEGM